jgi:hypothetical protein
MGKLKQLYSKPARLTEETALYYSRWKAIRSLLLLLSLIGMFIWILFETGHWFGWAAIISFSLIATPAFIQLVSRKPGLLLSRKGCTVRVGFLLQTRFFYPWQEVKNERLSSEIKAAYRGYYTVHYLEFEHKGETQKLIIDDYQLNCKEILKLFSRYKRGGY